MCNNNRSIGKNRKRVERKSRKDWEVKITLDSRKTQEKIIGRHDKIGNLIN